MEFNGTIYSYVHNLQGDIVYILDAANTRVVEYKYDAWGRPTGTWSLEHATDSTLTSEYEKLARLNPFRYRGYVWDEETGLYYLRSRYYDPAWGRFINSDNMLGSVGDLIGHNAFAYCRNEPIQRIDADGNVDAISGASSPSGQILGGLLLLAIKGLGEALESLKNIEWTRSSRNEEPTVIYRRGSLTNRNLTPRPGVDYNGLSFSTIPPANGRGGMTTVEEINATGVLVAEVDPLNPTHYLVKPTYMPKMEEWMATRETADTNPHLFTTLLKYILKDMRG